ncbi:eukaryotic translation initiation factor 3 subunit 8 N-terminus-domain-containing protein [Powellomyces hirtus]|nr:eukaryotic translation initiation factor 3 subunit 8 N-terminus-domain-containing protein [Powellomyces hirtus]
MSRFFRGGESDSDSESDDYSSSDQEQRNKDSDSEANSDSDASASSDSDSDADDNKKAAGGANRFMRGFAASDSDEDSEDDSKRVVKSARDKRFDEMRTAVKGLKNAQKINDWVAIQNEFERLNKGYSKAAAIIQREGVPRFYIRTIIELEDFMKEALTNKDAIKKMNASSSRALNAMKQKLRKHNKQYEADIEKFQANPVDEEASADEAEAAAAKKVVRKPASDDSDSDSDDDTPAGRDKWVKVSGDEQSDSDFDQKKAKKRAAKAAAADGKAEGADDFQVVGKGGKVFEVKPENLFKKLQEIIEARGKKGTDRQVQMDHLQKILDVAVSPYQKVKVLLALIPSRFDSAPTSTGYMAIDVWKNAANELNSLFGFLEESNNIRVVEFSEEEDEETVAEGKFKNGEEVTIRGSLNSLIDRIDDEFTKSLQHIDPHTLDYISRLRDETVLYALLVRAQKYFERIDFTLAVDQTKMRRIEHLYYKPDLVIQAVEKEVRTLYPTLNEELEEPVRLVENLCTSLYKTDVDRVRTRALLCHVYHLALHDNFQKARDMLLMSHLQDHVGQTEVFTQILFNRTMVQLGLCAFRSGLIRETTNALQEISSSGKVKELLAQGVQMQRYSEKTPEQERLEKQRQLPFHMHINLELLECVYLTASMLLEIPNMAANAHEPRRKVISKPFRRMLDYNERQGFTGPPENTRDHIMGAAKALAAGEWQRCQDLIHTVKIWELMPQADKIKDMLTTKIKEEGLRTYLFTYAPYYDSLGQDQLASMFDLPALQVRGIISRMIINEEIDASIDQPTNTIVLHRASAGDVSRLEHLAGVYADKVSSLVESNEKLLEARSQHLGLQQQQQQQQQRGDNNYRGGNNNYRGGDRNNNSTSKDGNNNKGGDRRGPARQSGYGGGDRNSNRSGRGGRGGAQSGRVGR